MKDEKEFKIGDRVKVISDFFSNEIPIKGKIGEIIAKKFYETSYDSIYVDFNEENLHNAYLESRFIELVNSKEKKGENEMTEESDFKYLLNKRINLMKDKKDIELENSEWDKKIRSVTEEIEKNTKLLAELKEKKLKDTTLISEEIEELDKFLKFYEGKK